MMILFSLASLPMIYAYSFSPNSELIGFVTFFILNAIGVFLNMIFDFISVFSQAQAVNATSQTRLSSVMNNITWALAVIFPSVNLKRALFNIRLKSNPSCISSLNSLFFASYSSTDSWMAVPAPGLGAPFIIFAGQIVFWWIFLILIENGAKIKTSCRRSCRRDREMKHQDDKSIITSDGSTQPSTRTEWDDIVTVSRISVGWKDDVCRKN
jgi:hypothetical protein